MADAVKTEPVATEPAKTTHVEASEPTKRSGLPAAVKWIAILVVVAALAIGVSMYLSYASERESTDDAQIDGHIYPVSAMIDGTVLDVLFDNNQYVQAGTVLGHIDPRFYQAALEKARGDLAEANATEQEYRAGVPITSINTTTQLSGAEAGVAEQSAKIATAQQQVYAANERLTTAQARVREAQANAAKAASDLARMKPLVAKEEVSRQQYDAVVAVAATASAAEDSASSQVKEAQQGVQVAQAQLEQECAHMLEVRAHVDAARSGPEQIVAKQALAQASVAQVQQKQAALDQAQIDLGYTTLRAPVNGLVSERSMEPGQTVGRGQALMAIVPLEDVWVTANFKESQLAHMHPGQPVEIEVKMFFEKDQDTNHLLRPGMSVTPTVLVK
jgi:membrane fusion protein (multidrug efflux system)